MTGEGEGEYEGLVYYYNEASGESTWDHPLDEYYRLVLKASSLFMGIMTTLTSLFT